MNGLGLFLRGGDHRVQGGCHRDGNQFQINEVYPGADELVAYWMGRYHGFLGPGE